MKRLFSENDWKHYGNLRNAAAYGYGYIVFQGGTNDANTKAPIEIRRIPTVIIGRAKTKYRKVLERIVYNGELA